MDIPEIITKVFTKYDTIPDQIEDRIPIEDSETTNWSIKGCYWATLYRRFAINQGLEGILFVYYQRVYPGGFITEGEGKITITDCKATGELDIAGRTNGKSLAS